jgi:hypothetical protein
VLHPNTSLNFQLNRWLAWMTPEALPDVAAAAATVRGYADFTAPFSISAIGSSPRADGWTRRSATGRRVLPQAERRA